MGISRRLVLLECDGQRPCGTLRPAVWRARKDDRMPRNDSVFAVSELKGGPVLIDGADLIVDQTGGQGVVANMVLVEIHVLFRLAFGMNDPDGGSRRQASRQQLKQGGEIAQGANEAQRQARLRSHSVAENHSLRKLAEDLLESIRRGDQSDLHVAADPKFLQQRRG